MELSALESLENTPKKAYKEENGFLVVLYPILLILAGNENM